MAFRRSTPQTPWHGYRLGAWTAELERQAQMATVGEHFALGEEFARMRRADVAMNTPVDIRQTGAGS